MNLKPAIAATIIICAIYLVMVGAYLDNRFGIRVEHRNSLWHVPGDIQTVTQRDLAYFVDSVKGTPPPISMSLGGPSTRGHPNPPTIRGNPMYRRNLITSEEGK